METIFNQIELYIFSILGAFFYDVKQKLIVCKAEPNPTKPLGHPVMSCIENLATKQMENTSQQYLGTGY
jgi:hypothetical protein